MPLTPGQCRAARALLDCTQDDLAAAADVSRSTVRGFEGGQHSLHRASTAAIRRALEARGVFFLDADEHGGPGVRLGRKEPDGAGESGRGRGGGGGPEGDWEGPPAAFGTTAP